MDKHHSEMIAIMAKHNAKLDVSFVVHFKLCFLAKVKRDITVELSLKYKPNSNNHRPEYCVISFV